MSSLFGSLDTTKLDKADVVDPSAEAEAGKAADAKSTYEELTRISGMASDAKELAESKADQLALEAHVASTNNPHSVTAEQVNAYTKETVDAKLDEKADIVGGKIPASQLPSYVDDVLEYDTMSAFPVTGEGGKIYVAKDTNLTYRWSGTQYVEISPSPLLDDTVTEKSPNGVKSSGIWSWVKSLLPKWLTSDYAEPATVASVKLKADKATTLAGYGITDAVPFVKDWNNGKTAVTIGVRKDGELVGEYSFANGGNVTASGYRSHAEGGNTTASADNSHSEGSYTTASNTDSHAEGNSTTASGPGSHAEGISTTASGIGSHAAGIISETREEDKYAFAWNGDDTRISTYTPYISHGPGTFNINPVGGLNGFYIGEQTLPQVINVAIAGKADKSALETHVAKKDNPHAVTAAQVGAVPLVKDVNDAKTAVTIGSRIDGSSVGEYSFVNGEGVTASGYLSHAAGGGTSAYGVYSHAEGITTTASGDGSHSEGNGTAASGPNSHAEGDSTTASGSSSHAEGGATTASGDYSHAEGNGTAASGPNSHAEGAGTTAAGSGSHAEGIRSQTREDDYYAFAWNGDDQIQQYTSHGKGTFNINPKDGLNGFFIGERKFSEILSDKSDCASLAPEYSVTSAYSVGAIVYHDGNIYQCKTAIAEGGEAWNAEHWELRKLEDFFTDSNSLLTGTIDAEVISKGTAPDAHLEAPTDEHLKLILADNSVAYDSAKALPYKLTSVIGDRVIATMTLTAASTDITLPTIAANDTTVKDFILDVTNAYAVEGVATDAGINIPRTDFKLVTRDSESLTDVTTVKAGKSAFICFTQKSPVVVDGTTYPCWCVIQLPFGDPS